VGDTTAGNEGSLADMVYVKAEPRYPPGGMDQIAGLCLSGAPAGVRHMLTDSTGRIEESRRLIEQSLTLLAIGQFQMFQSRALIAKSSRACAVVAPCIIVRSIPDPSLINSPP
jgi:hypothetical protein